jgi:hypothetical protein
MEAIPKRLVKKANRLAGVLVMPGYRFCRVDVQAEISVTNQM